MSINTTTDRPPRKIPAFMNRIMSLVLRSPLHGMMSSQLMLISFRGRKSGKLYTTPVGYMKDGQQVTLFTDHQWWKNLQNNATATVHIQGKSLEGTAEVVLDKEVTREELYKYLKRLPNAGRAFAVKKDAAGEPDAEELQQAAQRFTMMRLHLQ